MTTDTPRTDSVVSEPCAIHEVMQKWEKIIENSRQLERELAQIRTALGDDGRRTHKEILEMAFKASGWREWKQKYIDLRNAHIAEGQDPAGTIWEHADKIQKELAASKAEVERLRGIVQANSDELDAIDCALGTSEGHSAVDHIVPLRAEVERLRSQLKSAVEIAEEMAGDNWPTDHPLYAELDQLKATLNPAD